MEGFTGDEPDQKLLEMVARTMRHEVGDLLQTVYATVAILQERLPPQTQERRLLGDLRHRAETCRNELDALHDLVCPLNLRPAAVDLAELVSGLVRPFAARFTERRVVVDAPAPVAVEADARRLAQCGYLLVLSACQSAQKEVHVRVAPGEAGGLAEWSITDDGMGPNPELLRWLEAPFSTTHQALGGLGLALARRIVEQLRGRVEAGAPPEGGFRVRLLLPALKLS